MGGDSDRKLQFTLRNDSDAKKKNYSKGAFMKIVSVCGWSNTGKTTFVEKIVLHLSDMGKKCAVIKKSHKEPDRADAGKDSERFFASGADIAYVCDNYFEIRKKGDIDIDELFIQQYFPDADFVFLEGPVLKKAYIICMAGNSHSVTELKIAIKNVNLVVTDSVLLSSEVLRFGIKVVKPDNIEEVINLLISGR